MPPGRLIPAKQLWGGNPAAKLADLTPDQLTGMVRTCEVTAELAKIHMEEAWKELSLVEQDAEDHKRARHRTVDRLESMRDDPKWVPMPSLGENLSKIGVHSNTFVPP
mgnify:CR=1 FL=1